MSPRSLFNMSSQTETMPCTSDGSTTPTQRTETPPITNQPVVYVTLPPGRSVRFRSMWNSNDSHLVALFAFLTGIGLSGSLTGAVIFSATPQCWLYVTSLCIFHFMEYFITAKYKPFEVTLDGIFFP